jgi:hypothetical protein
LTEWLSALNEQFGNRKLPFGAEAGEHWALMTVALESQGKSMPLMLSLNDTYNSSKIRPF